MTIRDELAHTYRQHKKHSGEYGIELETETIGPSSYPPGFLTPYDEEYKIDMVNWKAVTDGSLRNFGIEFILKKPLMFAEALDALDEFSRQTKKIDFLDSPSTSTHVHIDMLGQEFKTLGNFLTLWTLFENILVHFSGPTRRSNLFALPIRLAEENVWHMVDMFKRVEAGNSLCFNFSEGANKYGAINICPLKTLGSVEARCFRGTSDMEEVKDWLRILDKMLRYAQQDISPRDIMRSYKEKRHGLIVEVFKEMTPKLCRGVRDVPGYIKQNRWNASQIAASVENWDKINTAISSRISDKKIEKKSKADAAIAQYMSDLNNLTSSDQPYIPPTAMSLNEFTGLVNPVVEVGQTVALDESPEVVEGTWYHFDQEPDDIEEGDQEW